VAWSNFYISKHEKKASLNLKSNIKENILLLKYQMNDKIKSFVINNNHKINITPYWLLGFIEGEAWFYVKNQSFSLTFGIGQTILIQKTNTIILNLLYFKYHI
jgi:hypothetical protein